MIRAGRAAAVTLCAVAVLAASGCQQSPLRDDLPRTPFSRYQALRGDEPPETELDTFGNPRPALRARLSPMDRP